jgi:hypothetical protein
MRWTKKRRRFLQPGQLSAACQEETNGAYPEASDSTTARGQSGKQSQVNRASNRTWEDAFEAERWQALDLRQGICSYYEGTW